MKILINEINNNGLNFPNKNTNNENNYKMIKENIDEIIRKCEKYKGKIKAEYINFMKSFIIELVKIINNQGYKDINKFFLNQFLNIIIVNHKKYSSNEISNFMLEINKLIKNPDSFLCPNAFEILQKASNKKIRPRSRGNSFDKNEFNNNINGVGCTPNKNNLIGGEVKNAVKKEKNKKIDDFFKKKESEEDDNFNKKFSRLISFQNCEQVNLNENNSNKIKFNSMSSFLSNNSFQNGLDYNQNSNLLNLSKLSGDEKPFKYFSHSELFPQDSQTGINSKLFSQIPSVMIEQYEKKSKFLGMQDFMKKLGTNKTKKGNFKRKIEDSTNKKFRNEIKSIVNDDFYNKHTTAADTKKMNKNKEFSDSKKNKDKLSLMSNEILVSKTPVKPEEVNNGHKDNDKEENIPKSGIRKNLRLLFSQTHE